MKILDRALSARPANPPTSRVSGHAVRTAQNARLTGWERSERRWKKPLNLKYTTGP